MQAVQLTTGPRFGGFVFKTGPRVAFKTINSGFRGYRAKPKMIPFFEKYCFLGWVKNGCYCVCVFFKTVLC